MIDDPEIYSGLPDGLTQLPVPAMIKIKKNNLALRRILMGSNCSFRHGRYRSMCILRKRTKNNVAIVNIAFFMTYLFSGLRNARSLCHCRYILEKNAGLLQRALKIADAYTTQCNEDIMYEYYYRTYDFHIWLALASKVEVARLQKIKEQVALLDEKALLRERQDAFLEMYSDF
jgi:hypothetical protein